MAGAGSTPRPRAFPKARASALGARFEAGFFARPVLQVAPELLGARIVRHRAGSAPLVARIVEVEAYLGDGSDPASHAHRGPTPRSAAMFGPPGRLYVYRSYGIHVCANVVCEAPGRAAAVLLRAIEPLAGEEVMRRSRGLPAGAPRREIGGGPGRLCQALRIGLEEYGASLLRGPLELRRAPAGEAPPEFAIGPRIGIRLAAHLPYRFCIPSHPCLSRPAPDAPARRRRARDARL